MSQMGYITRQAEPMNNGARIMEGMNDLLNSQKLECKDYPVREYDRWKDRWDDGWDDGWANDGWRDSYIEDTTSVNNKA